MCAVSAISRPRTTTLSHVDISDNLFAACAALNLATFCCGVSPESSGFCPERDGNGLDCIGVLRGVGDAAFAAKREAAGFEKAWGEVAVNRVASATERDILLHAIVLCAFAIW